jgi:hypothetical protein
LFEKAAADLNVSGIRWVDPIDLSPASGGAWLVAQSREGLEELSQRMQTDYDIVEDYW